MNHISLSNSALHINVNVLSTSIAQPTAASLREPSRLPQGQALANTITGLNTTLSIAEPAPMQSRIVASQSPSLSTHTPDLEAARPQTIQPSKLKKAVLYSGSALDAAAAGASLAATRFAAPGAVKVVALISGGLWTAGAGVSEVGNSLCSATRANWVTSANVLGAVAGALSTLAPLITGKSQSRVAYSCAASWVANGIASMMRAAQAREQSVTHKILHVTSGAANIAAAGLAAASTTASLKNESIKAANLGLASSVIWGVGSLALIGATWTTAPEAASGH